MHAVSGGDEGRGDRVPRGRVEPESGDEDDVHAERLKNGLRRHGGSAPKLGHVPAVNLGMPKVARNLGSASQVPPDQGRQGARRRRRPGERPVDDDDADHEHQRDPAADRRAHRIRMRHRARRGAQPGRRGCAAHHREEEPDPGHRRHPLPAEVRVPGDRRRVRGGPREPGQHPQVRRPGGRDREGRQGCRRQHPDRRQRRIARPAPAAEVRQGHARRRSSRAPSGRRACSRSTTSTTSRSRSSTTTRSSWSRPTACSPSAATGRCTSA